MTRSSTVVARIGLIAASLVIALVVAEIGYRISRGMGAAPKGDDEEWRNRYRHMNETLYRRSADPQLIYEPTPSSSVAMEYGEAAFNAAGMRDERDYTQARGPLPRVAMIGDSLVWSEFVDVEHALPRQVERALGGHAEVLNFGVSGYSTEQEARWYATHVRAYHPNFVVVVYCMNDMLIMSGPFERYATDTERAAKHRQDALFDRAARMRRETIDGYLQEREQRSSFRLLSHALGIFERARFDHAYVDEYLIAGQEQTRRERVRASLHQLSESFHEDGIVGVFVVSPILEAWNNYHWHTLHSIVSDYAREAGFVVLDPLSAWQAAHDESDMRISGDNLHYSAEGNRIFGEAIGAFLRERLAP